MLQQKKEEANSKNLVGNIQVDYKFHFLPELRANLNLGMDMATGTQDIYYPKESPLGYVDNGKTGYETIDKYNHLLDFICNTLRISMKSIILISWLVTLGNISIVPQRTHTIT